MPRPPQPSIEEAQAVLDRILERPHHLRRTAHSRRRGSSRNFDDQDARRAIDGGRVTHVDWHAETEHWVFGVSGRDFEGDDLTIVLYIDEDESEIRIITGY